MMTQKKRLFIVMGVILLILLLFGGAFAYLYFATDLFKTNQQLFFKYISQNSEIMNFVPDANEAKQKQTLNQRPYEFSGNVTFQCSNMPDSEIYNKISMEFEGKNDANNQKRKQTTTIKNGEEKVFEWHYLKNGNLEGLTSEEVVNKYVAMESPSLSKVLALYGNPMFETATTEKIRMDFSVFDNLTEQEKKELQGRYANVLVKEISPEHYKKQKDAIVKRGEEKIVTNRYEVTISETELTKIWINLLETLKQDSVILEKIQEATNHAFTIEQLQENCENTINEIKRKETTDAQALCLAVYEKEGKLINTQILTGKYLIEWQIEQKDTARLATIQIREEESLLSTIQIEKNKQEYDVAISFYNNEEEIGKVIVQYIDVIDETVQNSEVSATVGVNFSGSITQMQYRNQRYYQQQVEIENLNDDNSVNISKFSDQETKNLLFAIQNRMEQLYTDKIVTLGLASNATFSPDIVIKKTRQWLPAQYSQTSSSHNTELNSQMIQAFNRKFELYATLEKNEKTVEGIIRTTYEHNKNYQNEQEKQVNLLVNDQNFGNLQNFVLDDLIKKIKEASPSYTISFDYDEVTKLIKNVKMTT